jgi:hypothetical protein
VTYGPDQQQPDPQAWFAALEAQSRTLSEAIAAAGRSSCGFRRIVQLALDARWPFASRDRYIDTIGRLSDIGFDELTVHWIPPDDGGGLPAQSLNLLAEVHGL